MYAVKLKNPTKKLKIKGECDTQENRLGLHRRRCIYNQNSIVRKMIT
jgi:hypothetical protein